MTVHGQDVQTLIDNQQGQIIIMIITVVVEGATGQHLRSKCQLAFHSWAFRVRHSRCGRERERRKKQVRDKVARPVNRSGFHSRRQNSWNWSSSTTRWTRDSKESSGLYQAYQIALFGKRPSPCYGEKSSNKHWEMTVQHYCRIWRSVNPEHFKNFESFSCKKCSCKNHDETGSHENCDRKEDPELPLWQWLISLELVAPQIAAQINASQSSSNRLVSTSTVQSRLRESDLHGWIAEKKPLRNQ